MYLGTQVKPRDDSDFQVWAQLGVQHICCDAPGDPHGWALDTLERHRDRVESFGLCLDMMDLPLRSRPIEESESPDILLAGPSRDRQIDSICNIIRNAARAGIPALKYNMNLIGIPRSASETGRGGSKNSTFRWAKMDQDAPPGLAGVLDADTNWERIDYFLARVVPVAEEYKVRLACHPHDPYTIAAEYWDRYEDVDIPLPRQHFADAEQDPHSQRLLKVIDLWGKPLPDEKIRDARRAYFGACSYVDDQIGLLLKTLADCRLDQDTIVVFSGDHGDMLGERGLWYKMHWFEMAARVPLLVHAPGRFQAHRVSQSVSTVDLLPTLVELAGGSLERNLPLDGRSLLPHLRGEGGHDGVLGEYMAEGTTSPLMMIRRGPYKFIYSEADPCLLFDLANDPQELENLAASADHQALLAAFLDEARVRWDIPKIAEATLTSQRRRRFVADALAQGRLKSWDHQPFVDASQQYMRNHIDLDDLERRARFPQP